MSVRLRIFLVFLVLVASGFWFLLGWLVDDLRVRYLESIEETMVDQAYVLASVLSQEIKDGQINVDLLQTAFQQAKAQRFKAQIYALLKTQVDLHVYVTNKEGVVLFDSRESANVGQNFTKWRDVELTLKGVYGARSTRIVESDPLSRILYIAAPILFQGDIVGVVTLGKPSAIINTYINNAKPKIWITGILVAVVVVLLGLLLSVWITRPIKRLTTYARDVRDGKNVPFPRLGHSELAVMGRAFDEMREALEGKKYVEKYVQTLTHEIKSPLAAIQGAAELLEEPGMASERRHHFLNNIKVEGTRIQGMIDRMLQLSAVENRKKLEITNGISVSNLIDHVVGRMDAVWQQKKITVQKAVDAGLLVNGEVFLLEQMLANIIQNAADFGPTEGTILVGAQKAEGCVEIVVQDEGPGIPDYAQGKIFERFFSLQRPDTGKKSSGLGLTFVREVVALHGGTVQAKNCAQGGFEVRVRLPVGF